MTLLSSFAYKEKQSRFLVYLYAVEDTDDARKAQEEVSSQNPKANHLLRVVRAKNRYGVYVTEASEDREPIAAMKKTASLMERKEIQDRAVYIVRYFGGTLFGASYLDKVYFALARKALGL